MRMRKKSVSDGKMAIILTCCFISVAIISVAAALLVRFNPFENNSSFVSSTPQKNDVSSQIAQNEIMYETDEGTLFDVPDEMRAVYLKPGKDFLLKTTDSADTVKTQIDAALSSVEKLEFNSIVIFTKTTYGVIYEDALLKSAVEGFDILSYILEKAKVKKIYTYVVYPVLAEQNEDKLAQISDFSAATIENVTKRAAAFAKKYQPSAVVFDSFTVEKSDSMVAFHEQNGQGRDISDYLRANVSEAMRLARNAVRQNNKISQIGFVSSGVWANAETDERGSQTTSDYESFVDGFADTRDFVLNGKFNFVMVENFMPTDSVKNNFKTIASWWNDVCSQADVPLYNVHASSKLFTTLGEFKSPDQLIKQVSQLKEMRTYCGSAFDSLSVLVSDKENSTTLLLKYFSNQIEDNLVFSKLKVSKPAQNYVSTYDKTIIFAGATDPNFKTTFNGKTVEVTEKGYFSIDADLKVGENIFKISHKGTTVTYKVLRKVKLLESVTPTGKLEVEGKTNITISVKAFTGSNVTAKINGTTVKLIEKKAEDVSDETVRSNYVMFEGVYKAPAAIETVQNLGKIVVTASWQGYSESTSGATIKVFAKPYELSSDAIIITEKYAETFPTNILSDQSQPNCYPLPAGTIDFVVGNELTFTNSEGTFTYYKLQSGHRVYKKDTKPYGSFKKQNNKISAVNVTYDGRFVNLKVDNSWSVPFKYIEQPVSYLNEYEINGEYKIATVTYRLFYTDDIDLSKVNMDNNPLISKVECTLKKVTVESAEIPVCDIVLTLRTAGGFFGATPSYTNNNKTLDIRLNVSAPIQKANNSYGYTLKGAVIVVDAGHNKTSPGAPGSLMDSSTGKYSHPEYLMNQMIRDKVVPILKNLGATVITIDNEKMPAAAQRLPYFQSVDPHLMICIHHNATNSSYARGAVGTYFNSYSQLLCKNIMTSVCSNYINNDSNRSRNYYFSRLKMTREQFYPSMLIECGFISNPEEHAQLIVPKNQEKIAKNIVKGLINYFVKTGSLNHADYEAEENSKPESSSSQGSNSSSDVNISSNVNTSSDSASSGTSDVSSEISSSEETIESSGISQSEQLAFLEPKKILIG